MAPQKMSPTIVLAIRNDCASGMAPKEAARKYGLAWGYVHRIIRGNAYPEVGGPLRPKRDWLSSDADVKELHAEARRRLLAHRELSESGCWLWSGGGVSRKGYVSIGLGGRSWQVHRLSYEAFVGSIPDGYDIDHACHTADETCFLGDGDPHRRCFRPEHLVALPHALNVRLGRSWAIHGLKVACPQGHPYDAENTYWQRRKEGGWSRRCRACSREYMRRRRAATVGVTGDVAAA